MDGLIEGATPPSDRGVDGSGRELARFPHVCPVGLPKLLRSLGVACQKRGRSGPLMGFMGSPSFWCAPWVCDLAAALGSSCSSHSEDRALFFAAVERAVSDPEWGMALRACVAMAEPLYPRRENKSAALQALDAERQAVRAFVGIDPT